MLLPHASPPTQLKSFYPAALKEMNEEPPEAFKQNHCAHKNQKQPLLLQKKLKKYGICCVCSSNKCKLNVICVLMFYLNHTRRFMLQR